jgi:Reverse transcriptase (RNA-dependent DNA polymerase)
MRWVSEERPVEWLSQLDLSQALANCHTDFIGDWHRDPWGWPELDWVVSKRPELVATRLNMTGVRRAALVDVAKENFGIRPAIVMDPLDRLIYQALVDKLSLELVARAKRWVYGWRLPPRDPTRGGYARQDHQWENYRQHLQRLASVYDCALKTDISSFFPSVDVDRVSEDIVTRAGESEITSRLTDLLEGWGRIAQRSGLPQRSLASAVLANMYLAPIDDVLGHYGAIDRPFARSIVPEGAAARWMDDIWLFGDEPGRLRKAQVEISRVMRDLGLNMNLAKTDVLEGDRVADEILRIQHSAVDGALLADDPSSGPLNDMIDSILERPEHTDRTRISFATTRMRRHKLFGRVGDFVDGAARMPQGADHLARLFRDSKAHRDLDRWYVAYCKSDWGSVDWSKAQLGTMFPSSSPYSRAVAEFMSESIMSNAPLALTALSAQRLASWEPETARAVFREAARTVEHPLRRRALGLASLTAGEERAFIRSLLNEYEENSVTLAMLNDRRFRRVRTKPDFDAG